MFPTRSYSSLRRAKFISSSRHYCVLSSAHNKRIMEMKNNYALFNSIAKDYPEGTYLGILDGKLVATADSYSRIADKLGCKLVELYLMSNKVIDENEVHVIPSPFRVGSKTIPHEMPKSLLIEMEINKGLKAAPLEWKEVAKPYPQELIEDTSLDRAFVKMRWVYGDRPYCTFAVSNFSDSHCYPMTFLVDTSSPCNYIKDNIFHLLNPNLTTAEGEKVLYIHGKPFKFSRAPHGVHNNVNILGIAAFLELPIFFDVFRQSLNNGVSIVYEEGRVTEADIRLME